MKMWFRKLTLEILLNLAFVLTCIFLLYVLIDFSTFSIRFFKFKNPTFSEITLYYVHHFIRYLYLFMPLSLMLTMIRIISDKQQNHEFIPLLLSGISKKRLISPFFMIASLMCLINLLNFEYFSGKSLAYIGDFRATYSKKYAILQNNAPFYIVNFPDGTNLIYKTKSKTHLKDVYWVQSPHELWHMKTLELGEPVIGKTVDHLKRDEKRVFQKIDSFDQKEFSAMQMGHILDKRALIPFENRSLTDLLKKLYENRYYSEEKKAGFETHLHQKLSFSFLPLLIFLALPYYLFTFTRKRKTFFISAISLSLYVCFFTLLDAATILAENQAINPIIALWSPLTLCTLYFGKRYYYV